MCGFLTQGAFAGGAHMDPDYTLTSPPVTGAQTDPEMDPVPDDPRQMEFRLTPDRRRILVLVPPKPDREELP